MGSSGFRWAVGIEDGFVPRVFSRTGRALDEYVLTQHDRSWCADPDGWARLVQGGAVGVGAVQRSEAAA